jgi:hypothetical protein
MFTKCLPSEWYAGRTTPPAGGREITAHALDASPPPGQQASQAADDEEGDLMPRTDISPEVTEALLKLLASNVWSQRKEALEDLEQIVAAAGAHMPTSLSNSN